MTTGELGDKIRKKTNRQIEKTKHQKILCGLHLGTCSNMILNSAFSQIFFGIRDKYLLNKFHVFYNVLLAEML